MFGIVAVVVAGWWQVSAGTCQLLFQRFPATGGDAEMIHGPFAAGTLYLLNVDVTERQKSRLF